MNIQRNKVQKYVPEFFHIKNFQTVIQQLPYKASTVRIFGGGGGPLGPYDRPCSELHLLLTITTWSEDECLGLNSALTAKTIDYVPYINNAVTSREAWSDSMRVRSSCLKIDSIERARLL
jgi:hypothetical protein